MASNTDGGGPDDIAGTVDTADHAYNLIGASVSSGGLTNGTNGNQVGVAPKIAAGLANNGGPTATIAVSAGSPAINAGSNNLAVDQSGNPLQYDQRGPGFPRFAGGIVSIGAYQYQPSMPLPTPTTVYVNTAWAGSASLHWRRVDRRQRARVRLRRLRRDPDCHRRRPHRRGHHRRAETDNEQVTISKSVTVTGQGTILKGSKTGVGFTVTAKSVTISGFTIENFATGVVVSSSGSLTLSGDLIEGNTNSSGKAAASRCVAQ